MANQYYKITLESGKVFHAEVPTGKKILDKDLNYQLGIWYENIEGGKYRKKGIEVEKTKEVPATGVNWLSFHENCLEDKSASKKKKEIVING